MVTTLAAFRAADKGLDTQPCSVVLRGTDGELYVAETDPATGALPVTIISGASGIATEATLSAINGKITLDIGATSGGIRTVEAGLSKAETPVRRDCSTANLNTGSWTEILASSASANTEMHFYNGTGYSIQLAFGAGGAEVLQYIVPPGGEIVRLLVPASTRISLQPYTNITDGEIVINFLK